MARVYYHVNTIQPGGHALSDIGYQAVCNATLKTLSARSSHSDGKGFSPSGAAPSSNSMTFTSGVLRLDTERPRVRSPSRQVTEGSPIPFLRRALDRHRLAQRQEVRGKTDRGCGDDLEKPQVSVNGLSQGVEIRLALWWNHAGVIFCVSMNAALCGSVESGTEV